MRSDWQPPRTPRNVGSPRAMVKGSHKPVYFWYLVLDITRAISYTYTDPH